MATEVNVCDQCGNTCSLICAEGDNQCYVSRCCNWGYSTHTVDLTFQKPPTIYDRPIQEHGGGKYLRTIHSADGNGGPIKVDIYCVIEAFGITCPALQHALKKILACGQRGKGDKLDDIHGVFDAMWRALELQKQRESNG